MTAKSVRAYQGQRQGLTSNLSAAQSQRPATRRAPPKKVHGLPARHKPEAAELAALEEAGRVLDGLMAQKGITEEQALEEFKRLRNEKKRSG